MSPTSRILLATGSGLLVLLAAACGTPGTFTGTSGSSSILNLSVNNTAANVAVLPPEIAASKAAGEELPIDIEYIIQPAVVSSGSVSCISVNSSGTKTTVTGTLDESGNVSLQGIPNNQETICYLLNAAGSVLATIPIADSSAIGSLRDGFKFSSEKTKSSTVSYNGNLGTATNDCSNNDCQAPASGGADSVNPSGTYTMTCNGIRSSVDDSLDSSQSCPAELDGKSVFIHQVLATDSGGTARRGAGAWPSQTTYTTCGSTEGLQNLPSGWTVSTSSQTGDFSWSAPFQSFSSASTSAAISTMIQNITSGPTLSFSAYQTASCSGLNASQCAAQYMWAQVFPYVNSNPTAVCWPRIRMSWSGGTPTFSPATGFGGLTQPMNRYDFMSLYLVGNQGYMKSEFSETFPAYNTATATEISCDIRDELLISMTLPSSNPAVGDTIAMKFTQTNDVTARTGVASDTTICQQQVGNDSQWANKGSYVDITMTMSSVFSGT